MGQGHNDITLQNKMILSCLLSSFDLGNNFEPCQIVHVYPYLARAPLILPMEMKSDGETNNSIFFPTLSPMDIVFYTRTSSRIKLGLA